MLFFGPQATSLAPNIREHFFFSFSSLFTTFSNVGHFSFRNILSLEKNFLLFLKIFPLRACHKSFSCLASMDIFKVSLLKIFYAHEFIYLIGSPLKDVFFSFFYKVGNSKSKKYTEMPKDSRSTNSCQNESQNLIPNMSFLNKYT